MDDAQKLLEQAGLAGVPSLDACDNALRRFDRGIHIRSLGKSVRWRNLTRTMMKEVKKTGKIPQSA